MAIVIDEVESTVEPDIARGQPAGDSPERHETSRQAQTDRLAADLRHIAGRRMRLKAD